MKKNVFLFYSILLCISVIPFSCKKDEPLKNSSGQVVVQGNYTLTIKVKHHWWGVSYLPVYLKKNAIDYPGNDSTKYEFSAVTDHDGNCVFNHLFPGNYYLYAHGFDDQFGMNVTGYGPVQLNENSAPGYELHYEMYVSE